MGYRSQSYDLYEETIYDRASTSKRCFCTHTLRLLGCSENCLENSL